KGREMESVRPWGRALAPVVDLEFSQGGIDYHLTKGFLEEARSELKRLENGRYVRFAAGDDADKIVQNLFTKNAPQRGLSRRENWGIAQVLWAPQGELSLTTLSGDTVSDIRQMLGAQVSSSGAHQL